MKKRNQLVSALLAGLIVGGMAGTTVWADTNDQLNSGDAAAVAEVEVATSSETSEGTATEPVADSSSASEAQASSEAVSTEASASVTSATDTSESESSAEQAAETPAEDPGNVDGEAKKGTVESNVSNVDPEAPAASTASNGSSAAGASSSSSEVTAGNASNTSSDSASGNGSSTSENKAATPTPTATPKPTATPAPTEAPKASTGSSSQVSSTSGASTGSYSYVLTDAQKRMNLTLGFTQVAKKYAVVRIPTGVARFINIREEANVNGRVVGTLVNGGLCYILSSEDNGKWYYVESGDVRGFVSSEFIITDTDAIRAVSAKGGETKMETAKMIVDSLENTAYRYKLTTVKKVTGFGYSADRTAMIQYAMQFLGRPYVWGGEDLWNGCDCSGYVRGIYARFGISLPRCSYEQCYTGTRIDPRNAKPGDLLFYARDGVVYHVLMYIGNGQAINAQSSATGIVISNVDYNKVCWATTYINDATTGDTEKTSTQASTLVTIGQQASNGDTAAQQQIIDFLGKASQQQWNEYGFLPSVQIAQTILESGWLSFSGAANGGIQPTDNNCLGMNVELLNDQWISPWLGTIADRNVPQSVNGQTVYGIEAMRTYPDLESCLDDEAAFKIGIHPDLKWVKDVDKVVDEGLEGYATDPTYKTTIKSIIAKYNLTQYDVDPKPTTGSALAKADTTAYTADQIQLIWAIVAQEDDMSYEGALAVITTAMNRADQNYGGFGTNALSQLTADGQFCYSPKVSNPIYWQRRLGGNVPDYVVQAVSDCLNNGVRSHNYLNFRSTNTTGTRVQIGTNWFF
ncbi:MAG: NlpC/P60 family protein [Lachnospiraceae bacterium]|nr:NlpC/P60 family protein [Lachnospiraceae bacterium]